MTSWYIDKNRAHGSDVLLFKKEQGVFNDKKAVDAFVDWLQAPLQHSTQNFGYRKTMRQCGNDLWSEICHAQGRKDSGLAQNNFFAAFKIKAREQINNFHQTLVEINDPEAQRKNFSALKAHVATLNKLLTGGGGNTPTLKNILFVNWMKKFRRTHQCGI